MPDIKDRIKEFRRIKGNELKPHPLQWKFHGDQQRKAISAVLTEVGFAGAILVFANDLDGGALTLVDGHGRTELTPDFEFPCLITDLNFAESALVLASFDPLSALSTKNPDKLNELLAQVTTNDDALKGLLDSMKPKTPLPPISFDAVGNDIHTDFRCPSCGYEWSGKAK